MLIPGQGPLTYRTCREEQKRNLIAWFTAVEILAWEWIYATFPDERPDKIFLVTGQTLTDEFDITHQEKAHSKCEVILETTHDISLDAQEMEGLGYKFDRASAFFGFEVSRRADPKDKTSKLHSVFLELHDSKPIKRIRFDPTLRARLEDMFK
jgi:hypothetical protein